MKKLLMAFAFIGAVAFASCKKEYICECTTTNSSTGSTTTASGKTEKDTRKNAKAACESSTTVGSVTTTCKLK